MHGSISKIPSKISRPFTHDVKFLALLGASYIYDVSRLRVKDVFVQGDQNFSVHLIITIQEIACNVQNVPRQSPDIY
jgi:hypothetical protein